MKAFLSHSSMDKQLVSKIAKELGRIYSYYDQRDFNTGEELLKNVNDGLADSDVFVLFASKNSLKSLWVLHEINEAQYLFMLKNIEKIIVFIIDDVVQFSELPNFLKKCKVEKEIAAGLIVNTIKEMIQKQIHERHPQFYVGRKQEFETAQNIFAPIDGTAPPKIIGINGLVGIGRTTFLKRIAADFLHFNKFEIVCIEIAETLITLAIKLAAIVEPFNTEAGLQKFSERIINYNEEKQVDYIKKALKTILSRQILPVFNEDGGLIDGNNQWNAKMLQLLEDISTDKEIYLFIVTRFKPEKTILKSGVKIPFVRVNHLSQHEINQLLTLIFNSLKLEVHHSDQFKLTQFMNGYPPSAYYTGSLVKEYGLHTILLDTAKIVEFRSTTFIRYINNLILSNIEKDILTTLSFHSPLPLVVIRDIFKLSDHEVSKIIMRLIDLSLVISDQNGFIKLSPPIIDAVNREIGRPDQNIAHEVVINLKKYMDSLLDIETKISLLEISRTLVRALLISNKKYSDISIFTFVSDLIRVTEELYHQQDYKNAKLFAEEALTHGYNIRAKRFLIQSLIKLGKYKEAEEEINEMLKNKVDESEAYFLRGYLYRNNEENKKAIESYKMAEYKHNKSKPNVALLRELAFCYFHLDDMPNSIYYIEKFNNIDGENRFIIDLQIQIALKRKDEKDEIYKLLEKLKETDNENFYLYRKSNVEYSFNDYSKAYESILKAYETEKEKINPQFLVQLITCELKVNKILEAEFHYQELVEKFSFRRDMVTTTNCRILLAKGLYQECLEEWKTLKNQDLENSLYIKKDAIQGILNSTVISDELRLAYLDEIDDLESRICAKELVIYK